MGFLTAKYAFGGHTKSVKNSKEQKSAQDEKQKPKARLLETEGENRGEELQAKQGASVRKVFGN